MGGLLNMNMTDFYRHYGDKASEESMEDVADDGTSQTEELYLRIEKAKRKVPFIELAAKHGLTSPDTADKTYRRASEKMRKKLSK